MKEHGEHIESRLKKLNDLREAGVEPFAGAFDFDNIASEVTERHGNSSREELQKNPAGCSLAGRLVAMNTANDYHRGAWYLRIDDIHRCLPARALSDVANRIRRSNAWRGKMDKQQYCDDEKNTHAGIIAR